MTEERSKAEEFGVNQEGSTARTEAPASDQIAHRHSCVGCPAPGAHFCSCGASKSDGQSDWTPAPASFQAGKSARELYPDVARPEQPPAGLVDTVKSHSDAGLAPCQPSKAAFRKMRYGDLKAANANDPEVLLAMVRETELENRRLGALVTSLRSTIAKYILLPGEAQTILMLLPTIQPSTAAKLRLCAKDWTPDD